MAGGRLGNNDVFFVFPKFWRKIWMQLGKSKRRISLKKVEIIEKADALARTT